MHVITLPKRGGGSRRIWAVNRTERAMYRAMLEALENKYGHLISDAAHGFVRGRSPVTNALAHVGDYAATLVMDFTSFFDSVRWWHLPMMTRAEREAVLIEGAPRQGLPTSPFVANLAASRFDALVQANLAERAQALECRPPAYTRYADDLAISFPRATVEGGDDWGDWEYIITCIARRHGFSVAAHKTRWYVASRGRRIITGIAVDADGIHPTRAFRRRLRSARWHGTDAEYRGLCEWERLVPPRLYRAQSSYEALLLAARREAPGRLGEPRERRFLAPR